MDAVREFITTRLAEKRLDMSEVSRKIGRNHAYLQQYLKRGVPSELPEKVRGLLAAVLDCSEELLRPSGARTAPLPSVKALPVPPQTQMPQDVPVFGVALGGREGSWFTFDNGKVVDRARRPPGLIGAEGVFAIFIQGDSMSPKYEPGDLVFVHPGRPPTPGCDVLIELHPEKPGEPGHAAIKRLVRRGGGKVVLAQLNPRKEGGKGLEFDQAKVLRLYRILRTSELFGV